MAARYARERLAAHRGTSLYLGNALAARLLKSLRDLEVDLLTSMTVKRLLVERARVVGLVLDERGHERLVHAPRVILATGGISQHPSIRRRYVPASAGDLTATIGAGASTSGAQLALDAGAQLSPESQVLAFWVPASVGRRADGSTAVFPHTVTDRAKPGLIAVNREGQRFVNEALSYHEFVQAQLRDAHRNVPAWLVCDSRFLWKYGLGRVRPFALSTRRERASGYLHRARTLAELAGEIGVAAQAFVDTVESFNAHARRGVDPEFGRGGDNYQRHLGDAEQQPNPCVAPLDRPPFYAVAVHPADLGMAAGVMTDEHSRALGADGTPIDGLYACGNDMHSVMNGAYPGPGITLGPALVFGYLAARHACGRESPAR